MDRRPTVSQKDLLLVIALLLTAAAVFFFFLPKPSDQYPIAVLSINGKNVKKIDLSADQSMELDLSDEFGVPVVLEVQNHAVRFLRSQCPDHICEGYGFISQEPQTAVCMPNRTVLTIHSRQDAKSIPLEP